MIIKNVYSVKQTFLILRYNWKFNILLFTSLITNLDRLRHFTVPPPSPYGTVPHSIHRFLIFYGVKRKKPKNGVYGASMVGVRYGDGEGTVL